MMVVTIIKASLVSWITGMKEQETQKSVMLKYSQMSSSCGMYEMCGWNLEYMQFVDEGFSSVDGYFTTCIYIASIFGLK
jgi:hypothetical protein